MKKLMGQLVVLLVTAGLLASCNEKSGGIGKTPDLKTDDEKSLYVIGHDMGTKLQSLNLKGNEFSILLAGIRDGVEEKESPIKQREFLPKITAMIRKRTEEMKKKEEEASTAFLEKMAKQDGVTKLESGMMIKEVKAGEGAMPKATEKVKVHYHGTLRNGKVFDSSVDRGKPAEFALNRVIPCWTEGLQKIKKGGKAELYCPPKLAYGDRGAPPNIKPGAALKFEVELIDILGEAPAPKMPDFSKMMGKMKKDQKDSKKK